MNNLIKKYNKENSILVISSYPEKGVLYSGNVCAVGGFAKNTIKSLNDLIEKTGEKRKIIVLTVTTGKKEAYVEDGILIIRCFKRNRITSYLSLLKQVMKFGNVKDALVEFEFASFGDTKITGFFPILLMSLFLLHKSTTLVLHQVIDNVSEISGHIGFKKKSIQISIYNILLKFFYFMLTLFVKRVVVLEEVFRKRLSGLTNKNKISVIPHGVDTTIEELSKELAKKKLGIKGNEFIVLYFGYLTWYKGVDWLVKSFSSKKVKKNNIKLIVAGGESFTQKDKPHYKNFTSKIFKAADKSDNIKITGFVNEKDIPLYFSACDVVVLPYRTMISSSGPLSLAFSFKKPLLISNALENYFLSQDFSSSLSESNLSKDDILFSLSEKNLFGKIASLDEMKIKKLSLFSNIIREKRSFEELGKIYHELISSRKQMSYISIFNVNKFIKPLLFLNR